MKLILSCSGGIVGARIQAQLDTAELAADLARRAEATLIPEKLAQASTPENPLRTDVLEYDLTLLPEGEDKDFRHYRFNETSTAPEVLEVIDELMREIIRLRARQR